MSVTTSSGEWPANHANGRELKNDSPSFAKTRAIREQKWRRGRDGPGSHRSLIQFPPDLCEILRPRAVDVWAVLHQLREAGDLRVEVVEVMQGDRLERHRQLRAAVLVFAVVADDHVLDL